MKKTCDGCSALLEGDYGFSCYLKYKFDEIKGIPLEECPKPRSNVKMVELFLTKEKQL